MCARLVTEQGPTSTPLYRLGDDEIVTLGRNPNNGIILHDQHVSRWHATITGRSGVFFLRDQGSVNGTRLDGRLVECETPLRDGQLIRAGGVLMRWHYDPDENGQRSEIRLDSTWLSANDRAVAVLAATIAKEGNFDLLPILADALEDAGCTVTEILDHCRFVSPHKSRCWVVDLIVPPQSGVISSGQTTWRSESKTDLER